jgi:hypothetical protein
LEWVAELLFPFISSFTSLGNNRIRCYAINIKRLQNNSDYLFGRNLFDYESVNDRIDNKIEPKSRSCVGGDPVNQQEVLLALPDSQKGAKSMRR